MNEFKYVDPEIGYVWAKATREHEENMRKFMEDFRAKNARVGEGSAGLDGRGDPTVSGVLGVG